MLPPGRMKHNILRVADIATAATPGLACSTTEVEVFCVPISAFVDERVRLEGLPARECINVCRLYGRWGVLVERYETGNICCASCATADEHVWSYLSVPHLSYYLHVNISDMMKTRDWTLALAGILLAETATELDALVRPFRSRVADVLEAGGWRVLVLVLLRVPPRTSAFILEELTAAVYRATSLSEEVLSFFEWLCGDACRCGSPAAFVDGLLEFRARTNEAAAAAAPAFAASDASAATAFAASAASAAPPSLDPGPVGELASSRRFVPRGHEAPRSGSRREARRLRRRDPRWRCG